ncbi:BMP family ABC transporter substrate-binding protein [Candidatus Bathyarchaeota archaeon]|jgi:basic membrane protein A|nr:MAG: BMP family ABC transporter substrate-binding protein [Candidatus Bathyarchaeota archaeon]
MSSEKTQLYAGLVIALLLGAAVGWVVKPAPIVPTGETVPKSQYDSVVAQMADVTADLEAAQAQVTELSKPFKVGMVTGTGGLGDKSFNDGSFSALQRAYEKLGVEYDYVEPTSIAEYEGYQRDFAMSGEYGLIVCIGFDQGDALAIVAAEYPNQNFVLVDMVVDNPNVASLTFKANEGSFLLGVVAAMKSETGKLGFVGGIDIPLINDFYVGYKAGAEWAVPSIQVLDPVYVGGWGDPTKGKELAIGLVELGADGIFHAAGGSGLGALEAADEQDVTGYGVDACQDYLNPSMFASMTKRADNAVYEMILNAMVGKFQGGFYSGGLKEGWVGMCRLSSEEAYWEEMFGFKHQAISEEIINKVLSGQSKVISGEIVVPNGYQ